MLIGYMRVSKADGSQVLDLQRDALIAGGVKPSQIITGLSSRQSAVLEALRAKMDENEQVAVKAASLAEAAHIPLGSLHSVLQSLEKKQLIKTARAPAVYQVL